MAVAHVGSRVTVLGLSFVMVVAVIALLSARVPIILAQEDEEEDNVPVSIYLPTISGSTSLTSTDIVDTSGQVYGLLGSIRTAVNQPFGHYLVLADGNALALVGATPKIEAEIERMAAGSSTQAKVWGSFRLQITGDRAAMLVADEVMEVEVQAVVRDGEPVVIVKYQIVNLRNGPGTRYPPAGHVILDQVCKIVGRNSDDTWWQVDCGNGNTGWISNRLVTTQGDTDQLPSFTVAFASTSTPTPTPTLTATATPTATPTPDADRFWQATFFDNARLADVPEVSWRVSNIDFDWKFDSPSTTIGNDSFSARFERRFNFMPGSYRFNVEADDGVRVWLDDQILIDEWHGAGGETYSVSRTLDGRHNMRVEYYESGGLAKIHFWYEYLGDITAWNVEYYQGTELYGVPETVQREPRSGNPIDYHWGSASPVTGRLPGDYWSARWTGTFDFEGGSYVFCADGDDGIRVYINDHLVLERWRDGYSELKNRFVGLGSGEHTVRVEYYDRGGDARLKVWWYRETGQQLTP